MYFGTYYWIFIEIFHRLSYPVVLMMRLRSHLDLNTKALTIWLTTIRTAEQEQGLWRMKQWFCFVAIVTEVQTVL